MTKQEFMRLKYGFARYVAENVTDSDYPWTGALAKVEARLPGDESADWHYQVARLKGVIQKAIGSSQGC